MSEMIEETQEAATFLCPHCESEHEDESSAMECCPPYACEVCGERHDYESDAEECCQYRCPECGELFEYESDAMNCCRYRCESCGDYHEYEEDAANCCRGGDPYYPQLPTLSPVYIIDVPELERRPARLISIEQELTGGGAAVAAMLRDFGLSSESGIQYYSTQPYAGDIVVCEDGSLPDDGGEVKYSKFDLNESAHITKMSEAVGRIRQLHKDASIVEVNSRAGMHIHHAAKDIHGRVLDPVAMTSLHELFCFGEDMIYGLAAAGWSQGHRYSGSGNDYAKPIPKIPQKGKSAWKVSRVMGSKYYGINFERLLGTVNRCTCGSVKFGSWSDCECGAFDGATVEWRVFNTSTMPETIHAWILFSSAVMALAHEHQPGQLQDNPYNTRLSNSPTRIENRWAILEWFMHRAPLLPEERDVIRAAAARSPLMKKES